MASGQAKKYILSPHDLMRVLDEIVTGLTFIPSSNLDEEIILSRFGEAKERIRCTRMVRKFCSMFHQMCLSSWLHH